MDGNVDFFCQNIGITAYTLENYCDLKGKFSFSNGNIFEIHDYFRTGANIICLN